MYFVTWHLWPELMVICVPAALTLGQSAGISSQRLENMDLRPMKVEEMNWMSWQLLQREQKDISQNQLSCHYMFAYLPLNIHHQMMGWVGWGGNPHLNSLVLEELHVRPLCPYITSGGDWDCLRFWPTQVQLLKFILGFASDVWRGRYLISERHWYLVDN